MKKSFWQTAWGIAGISLLYFAVRLTALTVLPVFADESIYIRWSQLILDDWQQYLFFPLNDGKTPLFIWLISGALKIFADPLLAGRLMGVLAGFGQLWLTAGIVKRLRGGSIAQISALAAVITLPFWHFHHRMALMDGLLTMLLSGAVFLLLKTSAKNNFKSALRAGIGGGLVFGLALLTKLPALLFVPALVFASLLGKKRKTPWKWPLLKASSALLTGFCVFFLLKLHPAFGQLFNRGGDFLYSLSELTATGFWPILVGNSLELLRTLSQYLTWPVLLLPLLAIVAHPKQRSTQLLLLLMTLSFAAPILLLGKTIYPRYYLPLALPLTIAAALAIEAFIVRTQQLLKQPLNFIIRTIALVFVLTYIASAALEFVLISWQDPQFLKFTARDREQYLQEWSSGHGIKEVTDRLLLEAENQTIAVATEGYFGTLPDGMLMYLHNQDVSQVMVEGIGQPIHRLPESFVQRARQYDRVWLVVNSHRQKMGLADLDEAILLDDFERPGRAPKLELWDITELVKTAE